MKVGLNKQDGTFNLKNAIILSVIICAIAELLLFNLPFYASRFDGRKEQLYTVSALTSPSAQVTDEGLLLSGRNDYAELSGTLGEVRSVKLITGAQTGLYRYTLFIQDDAYSQDFREIGEFVSHSRLERSKVATIRSNGNLLKLRVRINSPDSETLLSGIVLNAAVPFYFSPLRAAGLFVIILSLLYLIRAKAYRTVFDFSKLPHRRAYFIMASALSVICLFTFISSMPYGRWADGTALLINPSPNAGAYTDLYHRQLDAFLKGQVHIDIPVSEELSALENPYDPSARAQGNVPYQYDHAYYEGRYYSPLPPAPLLLYAPFYLFTGHMPSTNLICFLFALGFIIFASFSVYGLVRLYFSTAPALFVLLAPAVTVLCGAVLWCQRASSFYEVPHIAGAMFFMMAVYFALKARFSPRPATLALCALGIILAIGSRGVLFTVIAPVLVLLWQVRGDMKKGRNIASFCAPLLIGAALLLYYNYARFGSVFETGLRYQLAISDLGKNSVFNLWNIIPWAYHYLLQIPTFDSFFPFFRTSGMGQILYHNYYYCWPMVGALSYPSVWVIPSGIRCARLKSREPAVFIGICAVCALIASYFSFSLYGVFFRMTADNMLLFSLAAVMSLVAVSSVARKRPRYEAVAATLLILTVISCAIGFFLSLDGYYGGLENNSPLLFAHLKYMLEWWR